MFTKFTQSKLFIPKSIDQGVVIKCLKLFKFINVLGKHIEACKNNNKTLEHYNCILLFYIYNQIGFLYQNFGCIKNNFTLCLNYTLRVQALPFLRIVYVINFCSNCKCENYIYVVCVQMSMCSKL
jgi:hypothetical protein